MRIEEDPRETLRAPYLEEELDDVSAVETADTPPAGPVAPDTEPQATHPQAKEPGGEQT